MRFLRFHIVGLDLKCVARPVWQPFCRDALATQLLSAQFTAGTTAKSASQCSGRSSVAAITQNVRQYCGELLGASVPSRQQAHTFAAGPLHAHLTECNGTLQSALPSLHLHIRSLCSSRQHSATSSRAAAVSSPSHGICWPGSLQWQLSRHYTSHAPRERLSSRQRLPVGRRRYGDQALYLLTLVVSMVGLTYAAVPLYRMFCQATGFGGTVQQGRTVEAKLRAREAVRDEALEAAAAARDVTVSFNANVIDGLPWRFSPTQRSVTIKPGQSTLAFYTAHNTGNRDITGVSTYNVAPQQAGTHFNKIQCFCFEEQRLRAGEKVDMPVFFYLDPEFATDPRMKGVSQLTLSYTFFKVEDEEYDPAELQAQLARTASGDSFHGMPAPART